jgi:hypothetical protein
MALPKLLRRVCEDKAAPKPLERREVETRFRKDGK